MVNELYKTWSGRGRTCNVDGVIDALKYISLDSRARAYAKDCLSETPGWAWILIEKLVKEIGLEKELNEVVKEILNEEMKLRRGAR
jgi:hypothetical protein